MEKRHMDTIIERSEEFGATGATRFKRWELKTWFGAERIGKNVWRNLNENILEKSPDSDVRVFELDSEYIFVEHSKIWKLKDAT